MYGQAVTMMANRRRRQRDSLAAGQCQRSSLAVGHAPHGEKAHQCPGSTCAGHGSGRLLLLDDGASMMWGVALLADWLLYGLLFYARRRAPLGGHGRLHICEATR